MKYRNLGTTGIQSSVIALGTHQFSGEWGVTYSAADVRGIVRRAGELGVNVIDTAECYGDHSVEAMVGEAILPERGRWIVTTKFGHRSLDLFKKEEAWSAQDVLKQLEASLRALRSEYIDIYQFHSGTNTVFENGFSLVKLLNKKFIEFQKIAQRGGLYLLATPSQKEKLESSNIKLNYKCIKSGGIT